MKHRSIAVDKAKRDFERWASWPRVDTVVLATIVVQLAGGTRDKEKPGLAWWHAAGLLRLVVLWRISYFLQCAEMNAFLSPTQFGLFNAPK